MSDTKSVTISGHTFEVSQPYAEGHTCTALEAKALNQTRAENIANNFRKRVKDAGDDAKALDEIRKAFAEYEATYEFAVRVAGGSTKDPVEVEALKIARKKLAQLIKEQTGKTVKDYRSTPEGDTNYLTALDQIASNAEVVKLAKKNVAEAEKTAALDVGVAVG